MKKNSRGDHATREQINRLVHYYRIIISFKLMTALTFPFVVFVSALIALVYVPIWIFLEVLKLLSHQTFEIHDLERGNPVMVFILIVGAYLTIRDFEWNIARLKALGRPITNEELFALTGDFDYAGDYD